MGLQVPTAFAHGDEHRDASAHVYDASKVEETAFSSEGNPVDMADGMRSTPTLVTVQSGQTISFIVHKAGQQLREMVLGTPEALKEHAELMKRFPMGPRRSAQGRQGSRQGHGAPRAHPEPPHAWHDDGLQGCRLGDAGRPEGRRQGRVCRGTPTVATIEPAFK
jgi:hypothetical protein